MGTSLSAPFRERLITANLNSRVRVSDGEPLARARAGDIEAAPTLTSAPRPAGCVSPSEGEPVQAGSSREHPSVAKCGPHMRRRPSFRLLLHSSGVAQRSIIWGLSGSDRWIPVDFGLGIATMQVACGCCGRLVSWATAPHSQGGASMLLCIVLYR